MLMNFIHAKAVIMAGSRKNEILARTFGSVGKMLSGKKYPQNFRAIRMLVEEMLQCILKGVESTNGEVGFELCPYLRSISKCSSYEQCYTEYSSCSP